MPWPPFAIDFNNLISVSFILLTFKSDNNAHNNVILLLSLIEEGIKGADINIISIFIIK